MAVALLAAALVVAEWWRTHPTALPPLGNQWVLPVVSVDDAVIMPVWTPVLLADDVHRVEPRVVDGSAELWSEAAVCRRDPRGDDLTGTTLDGAPGCQGVGSVQARGHRGRLYVRLQPRQSGTVVYHGYDVTYRDGRQEGVQATGETVHLFATSPPEG